MGLSRQVEIRGYDSEKQQVFHQIIPYGVWYDGERPVMDSDEERVRLNIRTIEGHQYDVDGNITVRWRMQYSQSGEPEEEWA